MLSDAALTDSYGLAVERALRELSGGIGVPDFVFKPVNLPKGRAQREIGDFLLWVGKVVAVISVKSRDPDASGDTGRMQSWLAKNIAGASKQIAGVVRALREAPLNSLVLETQRGVRVPWDCSRVVGYVAVVLVDIPETDLSSLHQCGSTRVPASAMRPVHAGPPVSFLRVERPQVVVTLGPDGRTGHPDHIADGALAEIAFDRAGDALAFPEQLAQGLPAWQPARLYHTAVARSVASRIGWRHASHPDRDLVAVDVSGVLDRKRRAAVAAHASQWALSPFNNLAAGWDPFAVEHFRPLRPGAPSGEAGGGDLFSGLA